VFQFFNVGAETIGKFDIDFIDAADVKAVRDSSGLSFSLNPGESKEQLFVFAVRIVFPSEKGEGAFGPYTHSKWNCTYQTNVFCK
jgi:hypothetical protein